MLVEIMGNKAGWLTLYAGMAGGADVLLLPEIPYDANKVCEAVEKRAAAGKASTIIAIAEGAMSVEEAAMKKKERAALRAERGESTATNRLVKEITTRTGSETRAVIPGHFLRGGTPSAYDRVLATQFGVYAAELISKEKYGVTVALVGNKITHNKLSDIAGKPKLVPADHQMIQVARSIGLSMGD